MGTRSGNVDPALIEYLRDNLQMDIDDVTKVLNEKSGFLGLSGYSSDSRDIIKKCMRVIKDHGLLIMYKLREFVITLAPIIFYLGIRCDNFYCWYR